MTVRNATIDDVHLLGQTLGRAFQDDPAMAWSTPNARRRERFAPRYFEALMRRIYLPKGEVYMTEDGAAAAVWAPPEKWQEPVTATLPFLPMFIRGCGRHVMRALRMTVLMESKHKEQVEPHYYLPFLGTDPAHHGKGYGSALLAHMLERCDDEGVPAYLEATCERNRALYGRHGFLARDEVRLPDGPPLWPMWREPR